MQKYGLNLLKGLDNKEKDDALKLYDIQSNFFLGLQYTHMFCSDRLFNILSVGCRYVQEDDLEVLLRIGEFDKTLEYFGVNKNEIFTLDDILYTYYSIPREQIDELIERVDFLDRESAKNVVKILDILFEKSNFDKDIEKDFNSKLPNLNLENGKKTKKDSSLKKSKNLFELN